MALATYSDLQGQVSNWMANSGMTAQAADLITLGEAHLNRELPAVQTDVTLTGTLDNRRIDVSAHSVVSPLALYLIDPSTSDETEITQKADGTFPHTNTSDTPSIWAMDGENIDFDCPLDVAYTFRFRIRQRYALSDTATTNWLLTNHPDVYLAAVLVWSGLYKRNSGIATDFASVLREGIRSIKNVIMEQNRALLTIDPALFWREVRGTYDGSE